MRAIVWGCEASLFSVSLFFLHIQSKGAYKQTDATGRPSPAATNFSTQEWAVCSERALKLTALAQGGGQLIDGFSGSLGAARVLTCNYEPFIGHNVNYTATQYSAHNTEALNHNPLNKTLKWSRT